MDRCNFFKGYKRLRQRDPLSPYLLILCMEYFSQSLKIHTLESDVNFHQKYDKLCITPLEFADNFALFSKDDLSSIKIIMHCLSDFYLKSGLEVNSGKSS